MPEMGFRDGVYFFKASLGKVWRRIAMIGAIRKKRNSPAVIMRLAMISHFLASLILITDSLLIELTTIDFALLSF
jgi:hypothetical protein